MLFKTSLSLAMQAWQDVVAMESITCNRNLSNKSINKLRSSKDQSFFQTKMDEILLNWSIKACDSHDKSIKLN